MLHLLAHTLLSAVVVLVPQTGPVTLAGPVVAVVSHSPVEQRRPDRATTVVLVPLARMLPVVVVVLALSVQRVQRLLAVPAVLVLLTALTALQRPVRVVVAVLVLPLAVLVEPAVAVLERLLLLRLLERLTRAAVVVLHGQARLLLVVPASSLSDTQSPKEHQWHTTTHTRQRSKTVSSLRSSSSRIATTTMQR